MRSLIFSLRCSLAVVLFPLPVLLRQAVTPYLLSLPSLFSVLGSSPLPRPPFRCVGASAVRLVFACPGASLFVLSRGSLRIPPARCRALPSWVALWCSLGGILAGAPPGLAVMWCAHPPCVALVSPSVALSVASLGLPVCALFNFSPWRFPQITEMDQKSMIIKKGPSFRASFYCKSIVFYNFGLLLYPITFHG